jgi:hypothetical protein
MPGKKTIASANPKATSRSTNNPPELEPEGLGALDVAGSYEDVFSAMSFFFGVALLEFLLRLAR